MDVADIRRNAQSRAEDALVRAVVAAVMNRVTPDGADKYFARRPDDEVSRLVFRANQTVGTTGGSGWASQLAQTATTLFVTGLGPLSAASQLFRLALNIPFTEGQAQTNVPGMIPVAQAGAFVAESDPIPVASFDFSAASLKHKKVAFIAAITRELAKAPRAEAEIRSLLHEAAALTLDAALFSSNAATTAAPAGLFYGVSATSPAALAMDEFEDHLASLVAALAPIAGDRIAFVASPARALQISIRAPQLRYPVLATSAISDQRLAAVALNALAVAVEPTPDIFVSQEAVVHMSDDPDEIVSDTGPTTADPTRSMFQTATLGIRIILEMDWALRDAGAVKFIDGISW